MRKNSARKWLHFTLDLLPVIILPIFAIYEINHNENQPISVTTDLNKVVDFNQQISNGDFENTDYWSVVGATFTTSNNNGSLLIINDSTSSCELYRSDLNYIQYHKYYFTYSFNSNVVLTCSYVNGIGSSYDVVLTNVSEGKIEGIRQVTVNNASYFDVYFVASFNSNDYVNVSNCMVVDLTQMFGLGYEPTLEEFTHWYSNDYYAYTISRNELLKDYEIVTYDNTDVGSQMMYSLYKPVKEYFNFDNVFTFGQIYDWFELNMFGGNAPMPIYIVWNIIVYQFLMDLIFLIYGVFMYIIDFTEDTLARFTGWSSRG